MKSDPDLEESPFSRLASVLATTGIVGSLLLSFLLLVFRSGEHEEDSISPDTFSVSAIGHQLLQELLLETGRPVSRSRHKTTLRAHRDLLVVAEPGQSLERLEELLQCADEVLLVLPKRTGTRSSTAEHWIDTDALLPLDQPLAILNHVSSANLQRFETTPADWRFTGFSSSLPTPEIVDPQLLHGTGFRPRIRCKQGTLLGTVQMWNTTVHVLSDPDLMANHGLVKAANVDFVLGMLDELRGDRSIVFDETLHGFESTPSLWTQLGRFPLALVLVHGLLTLALLGWIALGRFGPVLRAPLALPRDKQALLDNTANLLVRGGHTRHGVRRYFRERIRHSAQQLGGAHASDEDMLAIVENAATRVQRSQSFQHLREEIKGPANEGPELHPRRAVDLAQRIHTELEIITPGSRGKRRT